MCLPVAAVGLVAGLAATGVATYAKVSQANAQAAAAEANAVNERNAVVQDETNMNMAALRRYQYIGQVEGQQRAQAAANGVNVDFGTPAMNVADTARLGAMDVNSIYQQGAATMRNHDINIWNDQMAASSARSQATMAGIGGALSAGSSVLGAINQYGSLRAMFGGTNWGTVASDGWKAASASFKPISMNFGS